MPSASVQVAPQRGAIRRSTPAISIWWWVMIAAAAFVPVFAPNNYFIAIANLVLINSVVAISLTLLLGTTGQLSLGHAAFYALGAYTSANLNSHFALPLYLTIPIAVCVVSVLGWGVARLFMRLSGYYLAVATLGVGLLLGIVLRNEIGLSGGPDGMPVTGLEWFGTPLSERAWYWLFLSVLALVIFAANNLLRSPAGRALRALHDAEVTAMTCGVDVEKYKVKVFVLSCGLTGLMGALYAHYAAFITPAATSLVRSIEYVMMVVVGGIGSIAGAVVGAGIVTLLPQALAGFEKFEILLVGCVLLVSILFLPKGLVPELARLVGRIKGRAK